jgi:hypothetical protein
MTQDAKKPSSKTDLDETLVPDAIGAQKMRSVKPLRLSLHSDAISHNQDEPVPKDDLPARQQRDE